MAAILSLSGSPLVSTQQPQPPPFKSGVDLLTVQASVPKKLTKEQRKLVDQLAKALPEDKYEPRTADSEHDERNLFERVKDIFG